MGENLFNQRARPLGGPITVVPQGLREEMGRLAVTAPGLQDERLRAMMQATPTMDDARLVREIRALATNVGAGRNPENGPPLQDLIDASENPVRPSPASGALLNGADPRSSAPNDRSGRSACRHRTNPSGSLTRSRSRGNASRVHARRTADIDDRSELSASISASGNGHCPRTRRGRSSPCGVSPACPAREPQLGPAANLGRRSLGTPRACLPAEAR